MYNYSEFWDNLSFVKSDELENYNQYFLNENRSSTIFPVFKKHNTKVRLEFLTYWIIKHMNNVVIRFISRTGDGFQLKKDWRYKLNKL